MKSRRNVGYHKAITETRSCGLGRGRKSKFDRSIPLADGEASGEAADGNTAEEEDSEDCAMATIGASGLTGRTGAEATEEEEEEIEEEARLRGRGEPGVRVDGEVAAGVAGAM